MGQFHEFALSLSGGGARGIVHAGFIKALEESALKPAAIAGTSMGAIVGALYAAGVHPDQMLNVIRKPELHSLPSWLGLKGGIGSLNVLRNQLQQHIHVDSIEQLPIPLTVSVTNLNKACNELVSEGPLVEWVVASSSIPIIFEPVLINAQYYVDGGLTLNLPAQCLRKEGRLVVGINSNHIEELDKAFTSMKLVGERCLYIAVQNTLRDEAEACHLLIDPPEAKSFGTFEFEKAEAIFDIGYQAGKRASGQIAAMLAGS